MLKERSQTFKLSFIALDLFISGISFLLAFGIRFFFSDMEFYFSGINYIFLGIILSLTQVLAFISIELYHPRRGLSFSEEFIAILSGVLVNLLIILALLFFFRGDSFSRLVISYYAFTNIILTSLSHYIFRLVLKNLRKKGYNLRQVMIIGTGQNALKLKEIFEKHQIYGYQIAGYIKSEKQSQPGPYIPKPEDDKLNLNIIGTLDHLESLIRENKPDLVIYALNHREEEYLREALDTCDTEGIDLKVVPDYLEFVTSRGRVESLDGIPIISIRDIPIRLGYNRFIKRTFDFLFALGFILVFSPFYILIALSIKLSSRGPIFIKQERVGLDNESFMMLKFRSMYVQEKKQSDTQWTVKDDPRVTGVGKILRKLSLDETPQFFNVLMGSMSIVGPRPERPFFVEQFREKHHHYMRRHAVKAGITGWAQVNGLRGDTSIDERIKADIYYIENWSLLFDIKIILMTPIKGVLDKNAY
ncbi:MAG: undecaprenyl-phosphate glucose phosphotransferase [Leptospiraceae bacterium]|nr:undecaprenyl-phosphate glucose phosphotransferase [Leptospiraceae bacterium]MCP5502728.1 undecaprenyl-phosphate glucose phosphotransferase [Leptospiraceae bacterium]